MVLKQMKEISIFNGLLCSVYEDDTIISHNNNDPFDLTMKIGLKLKQTITNIKSQLMIQEMIGTNIDMNLDKQKNENSKLDNQERKDDWSINNNTYEIDNINKNAYNIKASSFIRLFVIRLIICKYIKDTSYSSVYQVNMLHRKVLEG